MRVAGSQPLERGPVLAALAAAVRNAHAGRGGAVVLLTGEAGIGKTSVVRAFRAAAGRTRVLVGACDDLLTQRAFGPLRDATAGTRGPLATALDGGQADEVFGAAREELATPTVLVVEDLHWADDATLDVLGHLARRIATLPAVLLLTFRDGSPHLHRWLGTLAGVGPIRLPLAPLSAAAVADLAAESGWDGAELHVLTGGNPFYVTEVLAAGGAASGAEIPATVSDAVLARTARLGERCRDAVEQLAVVPRVAEYDLVERLLGASVDALGEAERHGILEERPDGLAFRHELARRAVEARLPALRRRALHRAVLAALLRPARHDPARLVHHALWAGDADAVATFAPHAGREASAAGSHREALAHFTAAVRHEDRLTEAERARLADDHAWELYNANRFAEAVAEGERAVELYAATGDAVPLGQAQVRLSRHYYMAGDTARAAGTARRAVEVLEQTGATGPMAHAVTYHGALLALTGDPAAAPTLRRAGALARAAQRVDLVELGLNYQSTALPGLSDAERVELMRESLELALRHGHHEHAARGYTNLGELLFRFGMLDELAECVAEGLAFTRDRGFWSHAYNLDVHRCLLLMRRGDWQAAEAGLAELADRAADAGMLTVYDQPPFARLHARRGSPEAGEVLRESWAHGQRQGSLIGLGYPGAALAEWAWLNDEPAVARSVRDVWRRHADRPGAAPMWAEILRYCARAGLPAEPFAGCPEPWAAGLRGDWRAAAEGWARLGDPYEQALELADSGETEPTLAALRILDDLGATATAAIVRRRLKDLGLRTVPRGPAIATRSHPAGLTSRQADVLELIAEGLTNAEIAEKLVLSVRTVDHHVSAILTKLGVPSRRDAAAHARQPRPVLSGATR
jgi:DNA-binding CsgD family transcriptional regulator/tetratricopeptide (TPR) repeat protein